MTNDTKKERITIKRKNLAGADLELARILDVTEDELNLTRAKVIIEGKPAEVVEAGEGSMEVEVPLGLGDGPPIIVVTTESGKIIDVLTYEKGEIHPVDEDEIPKDKEPEEWVTDLAQALANAIGVAKGRSQRTKETT